MDVAIVIERRESLSKLRRLGMLLRVAHNLNGSVAIRGPATGTYLLDHSWCRADPGEEHWLDLSPIEPGRYIMQVMVGRRGGLPVRSLNQRVRVRRTESKLGKLCNTNLCHPEPSLSFASGSGQAPRRICFSRVEKQILRRCALRMTLSRRGPKMSRVRRTSNMRSFLLVPVLAALATVSPSSRSAAQDKPTGDPVVQRIYDEGMRRSQAARFAQVLMDSIGPRLTGSPANRAANDGWCAPTRRGAST